MRSFIGTASAVIVGVVLANVGIWVITPQRGGFEIREEIFRGTKMFWLYQKSWPRDKLIGGAGTLEGARARLKREQLTGGERLVETIP